MFIWKYYYQFLSVILTADGLNWRKMVQIVVACAKWRSFRILTSYLCSPENNNELLESVSPCFEAPQVCPNKNITFYLYTRATRDNPQELSSIREESFQDAKFIPNAPIKLLIHGYTGHANFSPNTEIRPVYLDHYDYNIISVDYGPMVRDGCYLDAVKNIAVAANCVAYFVDHLLRVRTDLTLRQFHVIGLSLGAQVAGQIRNYMKSGNFSRITGLDPALPFFFSWLQSSDYMLSSDDADFVDVIHTNAGWKGKLFAAGHVDFYANSGLFQPGCGYNTSCSHVRAAVYFAESIYSKEGFWAHPCSNLFNYYINNCPTAKPEDLILMGEHATTNISGDYFFTTNDEPLFALGRKPYEK